VHGGGPQDRDEFSLRRHAASNCCTAKIEPGSFFSAFDLRPGVLENATAEQSIGGALVPA
jgi:hypothetical protein